MLTSAPAASASMNSLVPDLAMVPRLLTKSAKIIQTVSKKLYSSKSTTNQRLTSFGHANPTVDDGQCVVRLVRDNVDEELRLTIKLALVR